MIHLSDKDIGTDRVPPPPPLPLPNVATTVLTHTLYLQVVPLGTLPDNIDVDEDGSLWAGCHPYFYTMLNSLGKFNGVTQVCAGAVLLFIIDLAISWSARVAKS